MVLLLYCVVQTVVAGFVWAFLVAGQPDFLGIITGMGTAFPGVIVPLVWAVSTPSKDRQELRDFRKPAIGAAVGFGLIAFGLLYGRHRS